MNPSPIPTQYAPAERLPEKEIQAQAEGLLKQPHLRHVADAVPNIFLALNQQRQIVFGNQHLADLAQKSRPEDLYGLRPGEVLNCIHSRKTEGGCGTTEFCRTCGAVHAILAAIDGTRAVKECRITSTDGDALDLRVWASPFPDDNGFISFVAEDISHEKRRRILERIFFHDVLNTAGGLQGLAQLLREETDPREAGGLIDMIQLGANAIIEEINAQKALTAAESGELTVQPENIPSRDLLNDVIGLYEKLASSKDQHINLDPDTEDFEFTSDPILVRRVMANLTKNALEASPARAIIIVGAEKRQDSVNMWVHNDGVMPRKTQLQIFQRSFSTKGLGRGLGTYSIKLLTERYLKGRVTFTTTEAGGTTFFISLPRRLDG